MSEMILRVSKAICEAIGDDWGREGVDGLVDHYAPIARAAIEAMREPTTAMLEAASPFPEHLVAEHGEGSRKVFEAATLADQMVARSTWIKMVEESAK